MSGLFGGGGAPAAPSEPTAPPSIDLARQAIRGKKKIAGKRGRAAALLVSGSGNGPSVAKRLTTGN